MGGVTWVFGRGRMFSRLLCGAVAVCAVLGGVPWRNCGSAHDVATLSKVTTFQEASGGKYVIVAVQGELSEIIGDGKISVTKYKDDLVVGDDEMELCERAMTCPMYKGPFTLHRSLLIPPVFDRGSIATFQIRVRGTTFMRDLRSKVVYMGDHIQETSFNNTNQTPNVFCAEFDFPVQRGQPF